MTDPQAPSVDVGLPEAIRVPLDELHADALYLATRCYNNSMQPGPCADKIRKQIDAARTAILSDREKRKEGDEELMRALELAERHCPCGARPEALHTHPHVGGCEIAKALARLRSRLSGEPK